MSFRGLTRLTTIRLDDNQITTIPANAFNTNRLLTDLSLYRNAIHTIDAGAFTHLNQLQQLKLFHNSLTTLGVHSDTWGGLTNLTNLDLSHNQITDIRFSTDHSSLSQLTWLDMEDNRMSLLVRNTFRGLRKLKYLNFNQNPLRAIRGAPFKKVRRLRYLSFNIGNVTTLSSRLLRGLEHLRTLYIGEVNHINLPEGIFHGLPVLQRLSLTDHKALLSGLNANLFEQNVLKYLNIWTVPFRQCHCGSRWIQNLIATGVYLHGYCSSGQPVSCQSLSTK